MRPARALSLLAFVSLLPLLAAAQTAPQAAPAPPPRDPRAVTALQQSVQAMGGSPPADLVATGRITVVAGSKSETGTIRILSRGLDQSAEEVQTTEGTRALAYSRKSASRRAGAATKPLPLELTVSGHSVNFPLALLAEALNDPTNAFEYAGLETIEGLPAHHIRFWKTFSHLKLQHLSELSSKDIWIEAATLLPRKLSLVQRAGKSGELRVPLEISFADYRNIRGVFYPFQIRKSLNGTLWGTITIDSVAVGTGLTDRDFPVR